MPIEPNVPPLEPTPIVDQPSLFPERASTLSNRPVSPKFDRNISGEMRSTTIPEAPPYGAASAFGFDQNANTFTRPTAFGTRAEREMERLIARSERQATLQHYNLKIGPMPFRFGAGLEVQFTDNVNRSEDDKLGDIIAIPHIDLFGAIQLTPQNSLTIQLSLGYIWDLNRPDQSRTLTNGSVGLDTDTGISFDMKVGNFRINVHDRPSIPRQQFDLITQRDAFDYAYFSNVVGLTIFWDANSRLSASFQYDHLNLISIKSEIESQDQSSEIFGASITFRKSEALSLGLQASASIVDYKENVLNDAETYSLGIVVATTPSRSTGVSVSVGYQGGSFKSDGINRDNSTLGNWYFGLNITHNINSYISQTLSIGRESQLGTVSNSATIYYIRHNVNLAIIRGVAIGTMCSYETAKESGGQFAQEFRMYQVGLFARWNLSHKLSLSLQYGFNRRDALNSDGAFENQESYTENRLDLGLQVNL
jgi:hypothetical protein